MLKKVVCTAPGKIILCGEHAVVYGKEAIACSLDLRTTCIVEVLTVKKLIVQVEELDLEKEYDMSQLYNLQFKENNVDPLLPTCLAGETELQALLEGCNDRFQKLSLHIILALFLSIALNPMRGRENGSKITLTSQLPIGGGLGSSASFAVSLTASLLVSCGCICSSQDEWSNCEYALINKWSYEAERIVHGTPSGIDNSISTFGHCLSFKQKTIEHLQELNDTTLDILVINTKVQRSTKNVVQGVKQRVDMFPELYTSLFDSIDKVSRAFKICYSELRNEKGDLQSSEEKIKHLIEVNQHLLDSIGVGHVKISEIIQTCKKYNISSKLTGAGCGGCVFAFIPSNCQEKDIHNLQHELQTMGYDSWRTLLGGKGVLVHDIT